MKAATKQKVAELVVLIDALDEATPPSAMFQAGKYKVRVKDYTTEIRNLANSLLSEGS